MINPDQLHLLLQYNPQTGHLIWKVNAGRRRKAGQFAGCKTCENRVLIGINGRLYKAHRVIWAMQTGEWPPQQIDHINEDSSDNRWENLRLATKSQNMRNITRIKSNTSGYKGVSWHSGAKKWRATIKVDGVSYHLGLFEAKDDAVEAYKVAAQKLHGVFAKH